VSEAGVALAGVRRAFGPFVLDVTLEAAAGGYTVILGPSGCGKSLLLGTVAGIFAPDEGRVLIEGTDVTELPPERRNLGFVFQKASLFPHLSVTENIAFGLRARGAAAGERRRRVDELIELFALGPLLDRPTPALSGGEAQRVAIARALAPRPGVLLLDEPLSLVDHNARLELQEELRRIHTGTGVTVLHVTHNREEARALGERFAVMLGGRIIQAGAPAEVLERPRCLFVARFLGLTDVATPAANHPGCTERCLGGTGECDAPSLEDA
jgi:ABC-type Fe3+/spermidine/putrescine transport system ATPase subunit